MQNTVLHVQGHALIVLSFHCVLYYLTISTLFHCHRRPDATGDEKDLREILLGS